MRRLIGILTAASLVLMLAGPVAAQSGPPQRTQEPIFALLSDYSTHVLFVNITAEDFCAWEEAGDFETPPPVQDLITVRGKMTGQGAFVETFHATVYAELWAVDGGDPEAICAGHGELLGTGTVFYVGTDNDLFVSGTRTNSFGGAIHGMVQGEDGAWRVSGQFRAQISRDGEFRVLRDNLSVRATR